MLMGLISSVALVPYFAFRNSAKLSAKINFAGSSSNGGVGKPANLRGSVAPTRFRSNRCRAINPLRTNGYRRHVVSAKNGEMSDDVSLVSRSLTGVPEADRAFCGDYMIDLGLQLIALAIAASQILRPGFTVAAYSDEDSADDCARFARGARCGAAGESLVRAVGRATEGGASAEDEKQRNVPASLHNHILLVSSFDQMVGPGRKSASCDGRTTEAIGSTSGA
jgi:hypothetical protein